MTFAELQAAVYTELKEGSVSSPPENYPLAMVKDFINEGYYDVFNQPNSQPYLREAFYTFQSAADTTTSAAITAGDATISVGSTTNFASSGKVLVGNIDVVTYAGKTATSLTGCTGTSVSHSSGAKVRYFHALPTGIDDQKIVYLKDNSTVYEYQYVPYEEFLLNATGVYSFTLLDGALLLPEGISTRPFLTAYNADITEMSADSDTPSLIPTKYHKMLVFYATGRALLQEQDERGYVYYNADARGVAGKWGAGLYFNWLHRFYARYNRRTARKNLHVPFKYTAR